MSAAEILARWAARLEPEPGDVELAGRSLRDTVAVALAARHHRVTRLAASTSCYALITEELARGWMSLAGAMGGHTVVAKLIGTFGTSQQKNAYLPRMATGELRATMALTEPGGGSDLQALRTVAISCAATACGRSDRCPLGALMEKHNALACRLLDRQDDYLRFTADLRAPPDNNGTGRDIRRPS